jgi:hypothetical protein
LLVLETFLDAQKDIDHYTMDQVKRPEVLHMVPQMTDDKTKRAAPASLRLEPELQALWESVAESIPQSTKHGVAVAALRYGLKAIQDDPKIVLKMEQEALAAKWVEKKK